MNTFPIIRNRLTNEHVMAAVFAAALLYMLPRWLQQPLAAAEFAAVLAFSLIFDAAVNFFRYKRPVCAVSAAVTAAVISAVTAGIPLWGQLLGALVALFLGKHIWGGTGKNPVNPAMVGILLLSLLFNIKEPVFSASLLLLPAIILSVVFIRFRPFAAVGFMAGMSAAILLRPNFNYVDFITYGVIFWGCIVVTDPVTVTANPLAGIVAGAAAGFAAMRLSGSLTAMAAGVLAMNLVSVLLDKVNIGFGIAYIHKAHIKKLFTQESGAAGFIDLTKGKAAETGSSSGEFASREDSSLLEQDEILRRIEANQVFGLGGAGFPTIKKLKTVIESCEASKQLIINGVECDPGLMHDHWLAWNHMDEICAGINILKRCIGFTGITLAVKDTEGIKCPLEDVRIFQAGGFYPSGAEKILIRQVLGRNLDINEIPAEKGILVLNLQTVYAVYEAVEKNETVTSRYITAADLYRKTCRVAKVRLGDNILATAEALDLKTGSVFWGGGAMQCRMADDSDVIDRTLNFISAGKMPNYKESPLCSKCGLCRNNCPAGIEVDVIAGLVESGKLAEAQNYAPEKCIQCGNCSRVCLAGRNLAARVKTARTYSV